MRLTIRREDAAWIAAAGTVTGVLAAVLVRLGNPVDGGLSVACPLRDFAGTLGLHPYDPYEQFSYLRPELAGLTLAACLTAVLKRSFSSESAGMPALRFISGAAVAYRTDIAFVAGSL